MAGLGEVKVSLGLDTSQAKAQLTSFFSGIGKDPVKDPFKGLDESAKRVGTAAKTAGTDLKNLGTAGKTAGDQLKGIGTQADQGLKSVGTSAKTASKELGAVATGAKTLGSAFTNLGKAKPLTPIVNSLKNLTPAVNGATTSFGALKTALTAAGQGSNLQAINGALSGLKGPLSSATGLVEDLGDELEEAGNDGKSFAEQIAGGFQSILQGIPQGIGLAIGQQLLAPLKGVTEIIPGAVNEFRDLEEVISQTLAVIGGGAAEFDQLQTSILNVSSSTAATAQEVGQVALSLSRAGFSLQEVDDALQGVVQGAEATGTSYENMGNIVVNAIGAFGRSASDATDIADSLTVAANNSNQSVDDLGEALKYVGPIASATGQSLEDTSLALQLLANSGIKGSQAGTSFRTILTNLQIAASGAGDEFTSLTRGSARLEKALKLIGANMTDANGELLKGEDLINELQQSMEGLSSGEKALVSKALAGNEGLPALNTLISASSDQVSELADKLENRAGASAKAAQTALSGLSGSFKLLQSNVSAFLVQVGAVIATVLKPLVDTATAILSAFNKLPGPIKAVAVALGVLTASVVATTLALQAFTAASATAFGAEMIRQVTAFAGAFSKANLVSIITNIGSKIEVLGKLARGALIGGLKGATTALTSLGAALKGLTFQSIITGFQSLGAVIGKGLTGAFTLLKGGILAVKGAILTAAPAIGAFITAAAPFIAIGAGIAAAFIAIKRNIDAYNSVAEPLKGSTQTLTDAMDKVKGSAEEAGEGFKSWGDRLEEWLGPVGRALKLLGPVYEGTKALLNILGQVDNWNKNAGAIRGANDEHRKFTEALEASSQKIEENRQKMSTLNPESEEYGRLAAENETLIRAEATAIDQRIKAVDQTISKLKENETANKATIDVLERMRGEYEQQKAVIDANKALMIQERQEIEALTGSVSDYTLAMQDAAEAREKAAAKNVALAYSQELQNIKDLKAGLISEEEARGRLAAVKLRTINESIQKTNEEAAAITEAYKRGLIPTQEEYRKKMQEVTGDVKKTLEERAQAEKDLKDATIAAIDARLAKMQQEVAAVQANAQAINSALSGIFSVQQSGYSALQGLVNGIAQVELTKIGQVKDKRIAAINSEEQRRIEAIKNSGASEETQAKLIDNVKKNFENRRRAAEKQAESERKSVILEQAKLTKQINDATLAGKRAELQLWYQQQQIQLEIQSVQTQIEIEKAKASGDKALVAALEKQLGLIETQKNLLPEMFNLKNQILGIEGQTKDAQLANTLAAEGLNTALAGSLPTLGSIQTEVNNLTTATEGMASALDPFKTSVSEIPGDVSGAVAEVKANLQSLDDVTFDQLKQQFLDLGYTEEIATEQARLMVSTFSEAGTNAGNAAATNIAERFGGAIPKALIENELVAAIQEGANVSLARAREIYKDLPTTMPTTQVSEILGAAVGGGAKEGLDQLKSIPVPEGIFGNGITTQMAAQGKQGTEEIIAYLGGGQPAAENNVANWILGGLDAAIKGTGSWLKEFASVIGGFDGTKDAVSTQIQEGAKDGAATIPAEIDGASKGIETSVSSAVEAGVSSAGEKISGAIQEELDTAKTKFVELSSAIDTNEVKQSMETALVTPATEAKRIVGEIELPASVASSFEQAGNAASEIDDADLDGTFQSVSTDSRSAASSTRSMASSTRSAASSARSYASSMARAASAAQRAARARWSGGPVQGGQSYTVNELGKEMFMSSGGKLSEIKAPAFGQWRAPSSGTVIPAHVAKEIRSNQEASSASNAMQGLTGASSPNLGGALSGEGGGITGAIAKGFKGVGGMGGQSTVNNVNVTSASPVTDASQILTSLARIRANRRR